MACGNNNCVDEYGCPSDICPDFVIKRHDTYPAFKVSAEDCDGAIDLTDENLVLEASIWATAKLKAAITTDDTYFALADNVGFNQMMVGDVIVMEQVRRPEHMLVEAFDETNKFVQVQRGYNGTPITTWKKGAKLKIFRTMGGAAEIQTVLEDVQQEDGTVLEDQLTETLLVYNWAALDTCTPGCYWLEFKLLKMEDGVLEIMSTPSVTPSFTPDLSTDDFGCVLGDGVEWARTFPVGKQGFLIKIIDSSTTE